MKYARKASLLPLALVFISVAFAGSPPVKLSSSGICHDSQSPHYSRTTRFTAFATLEACFEAGGRLPKGASVVAGSKALSGAAYEREYFGRGWLDQDGDCLNSRQEALVDQSTGAVRFDESGCRVTAGRWISLFSGQVIHDPSAIDIDHVVPLKWAWEHGADGWTQEKREGFANDPVNLLSVEASLNRSKGAKGITEWLPPSGQCQYVLRFLRVVKTYRLALGEGEMREHEALRQRECRGR